MYECLFLECFIGCAYLQFWDFPHGLDGKETACNAGDLGSIPGQEDPLEKEMATTPVFLPGEFHRGAWQATVHGGCKESDTTE